MTVRECLNCAPDLLGPENDLGDEDAPTYLCPSCGWVACPICDAEGMGSGLVNDPCPHWVAAPPASSAPLYDEVFTEKRNHGYLGQRGFGPIKPEHVVSVEEVFGKHLPVVLAAYRGDPARQTCANDIYRAVASVHGGYFLPAHEENAGDFPWHEIFAPEPKAFLRDVRAVGALIRRHSAPFNAQLANDECLDDEPEWF